MTATQRQRRRNTQGNVNTFTGAEGEFIYATDTHRISVHDGVKQEGSLSPMPRTFKAELLHIQRLAGQLMQSRPLRPQTHLL